MGGENELIEGWWDISGDGGTVFIDGIGQV